MKKCRPVVKGPSGGTLLFCFALPARGASHVFQITDVKYKLCLGAACTGCIKNPMKDWKAACTLPRRCLHGVHLSTILSRDCLADFASALPARGASATADKLRHTIL